MMLRSTGYPSLDEASGSSVVGRVGDLEDLAGERGIDFHDPQKFLQGAGRFQGALHAFHCHHGQGRQGFDGRQKMPEMKFIRPVLAHRVCASNLFCKNALDSFGNPGFYISRLCEDVNRNS